MHKVAILLGILLMAGVIVPFIPSDVYAAHNGSHIIDMASGNELINGSIVYVDTSSGSSPAVNFQITKPSAAEVVATSELLNTGLAEFLPVNSNLLVFSFSVSDLLDDVPPPVTYSVTFTTTHPSTSTPEVKNILIAIETEVPAVNIMFDRTGYLAGDTAIITVTDTRSNLHESFDDNSDGIIDFLDSIQVDIRIQGPSGTSFDTLPLQESEEEPGIFVGEYDDVPSGDLMKANYRGQEARANIGLAMSIDDTHYEMGDEAQLVVTDLSKANNGRSDRITVEVTSDSVDTDLRLDEEGDSGVFEVMVEPSGSTGLVAGVERITASVGDIITLEYRNQIVQATVIEPIFEFDRDWYANLEYTTITVVDKDRNIDKHARDTLPVEVTSDSDSSPITNVLIETGHSTATFKSYEMVLITDDDALANNNPHSVFAEDGDTITATYSGRVAETQVGIPGALAALSIPDDLMGAGESGVPPNDAQIIFPDITNLSCGSYGDTDADGLCNNWEPGGAYLKITYGGTLHTFTESCGPCPSKTKDDIYLEVDYDSTMAGYPGNLTTALINVKNAFAASPVGGGVVLHYYVDDALSTLPEDVKIWSDAPGSPTPALDSYTEIKAQNFGLVPTWSANKDKAWHNAVHYALVIKDQAHDQGSSGIAEVAGDDMVVSLFGFGNTVPQLQGTFMHELGHNLGLSHGGGLETFPPTPGPPETYDWYVDSNTNCKPNYPSVMSYMRQFTNSFTGNTLTYSPGSLTVAGAANAPLLIVNGLDEPEPNGGVRPPSGSTVTIVYGVPNPSYDDGLPSNYNMNLPIGPGNPVNFARMPIVKPITNSDYDVDWNNNGVSTNMDVTNNIFDIGILRCDVANNPIPTGNTIYDHKDWDRLLMNFRLYNPDSLLTGSRMMSPGISDRQWEQIKVHAVAAIDRAIQDSNEHFFFEGADGAETEGRLLQFSTSFDTGEITVMPDAIGPDTVLTVIIDDTDLNVDDSSIDEYEAADEDDMVTFSTDRSEVGEGEPDIEETGPNTGAFTFEIDLVTDPEACKDDDLSDAQFEATSGDTDVSIGACPGDLLSIRYDDENDENGDPIQVSVVIEIGSSAKDQIHNTLMVGNSTHPSVAANVQRFGDPEEAIDQLKSLRALMDGSMGGDPDNDVLDEEAQARIIPLIDDTLAMLEFTEDNRPYHKGPKNIILTAQQGSKIYEIVGRAETITSVVDTFTFDSAAEVIEVDLIGQGDIELTIPNEITDKITKATVQGEQVEFEEISSNSTHTTFLFEDLIIYPRLLSLSYAGPPPPKHPVTLTPPVPKDITGGTLVDIVKDTQIVLTTTAKNMETSPRPITVIVEVRDSDGVTVFLAWQTSTLNAMGEIEIGISWVPEQAGEYEIRVFAMSGLINPQPLSEIERTTITVVESGGGRGIPTPPVPPPTCMGLVCP